MHGAYEHEVSSFPQYINLQHLEKTRAFSNEDPCSTAVHCHSGRQFKDILESDIDIKRPLYYSPEECSIRTEYSIKKRMEAMQLCRGCSYESAIFVAPFLRVQAAARDDRNSERAIRGRFMAAMTKSTAGGDDFAEDLAPFMDLLRSRRAVPPAEGAGGGAEGVVRRPTVRVVATAEDAATTTTAVAATLATRTAAGVRQPELPAYLSGERYSNLRGHSLWLDVNSDGSMPLAKGAQEIYNRYCPRARLHKRRAKVQAAWHKGWPVAQPMAYLIQQYVLLFA